MITNGGAKRIIFPCVGFASKPFSFKAMHKFHAVGLSSVSFTTIAFNNPFPRTLTTNSDSLIIRCISFRKIVPSFLAFCMRFSSSTTSSAAIATFAAIGFPPNVEPCCPGLITIMISSSANTAETG